MACNKITNRKRFLDAPTLENAAAMAAANILPSQAALFTRSSTGELFTRGQMAYVQGFSRMAQDLIDLSPQGAALPSDMSPSDSMLNYLQKIGASFVCLYHNGNTKEIRGQNRKAARTEGNPVDDGVNLTSLSMVTTMESAPAHKSVPLEVTETADFKEYAQRSRHAVGARDDQDILNACCWVLPDGRRLLMTVMMAAVATIMMTMMPGSSNPKWIVIVLTLDHVFTIRTSSQIRCFTIHTTCSCQE